MLNLTSLAIRRVFISAGFMLKTQATGAHRMMQKRLFRRCRRTPVELPYFQLAMRVRLQTCLGGIIAQILTGSYKVSHSSKDEWILVALGMRAMQAANEGLAASTEKA